MSTVVLEPAARNYLSCEEMKWFWNAYAPDAEQRFQITASPNRATAEQLAGLPPALLLVA
jgi:acetyl esterase